jgi:hypothetical protein
MQQQVTVQLVLWALTVGFFGGFGWAVAHWLVAVITRRAA